MRDINLYLNNAAGREEGLVLVTMAFHDEGSATEDDRPELQKAIILARETNAELVVAKLNRLSRKASEIEAFLTDESIRLRVAATPEADNETLLAAARLGEQESQMASIRTKALLKEAKDRGVKLGGYRGGSLVPANTARTSYATARALVLASTILEMRKAGMTLDAIAAFLTNDNVETPRKGKWDAKAVKRIIERLEKLDSDAPPTKDAP